MTERRRGSFSVLAIPWVVAVRAAVSSEFRNERFNGREERAGAQKPGAIYRGGVAFRPICDFEMSGGMRATQRVAEVTWTGNGGGEEDVVEIRGRERRGTVFRILSKASSIFQAWFCESGCGRGHRSAPLSAAPVWILNDEGEARRGEWARSEVRKAKESLRGDSDGCCHLPSGWKKSRGLFRNDFGSDSFTDWGLRNEITKSFIFGLEVQFSKCRKQKFIRNDENSIL